jgi:hypothetical protein
VPDGRGARIALEAGFLVVVAAVLAVATVEPVWIVLVMLLAWVLVALLEWAAWREEPHWASGAPPRYYVPDQPLPPRPPTQELPAFTSYPRPAPRESDAPTWIATPEMREELLGWPAVRADEKPPAAEEQPHEPPVEALSAAAEADSRPEPESELEADLEAGGWPVADEPLEVEDRWLAQELPAEPQPVLDEEAEPSPEAAPEPEPEPQSESESESESEPEPQPGSERGPDTEPEPLEVALLPVGGPRLARHRIEPFAEPAARRLPWRKHSNDPTLVTELPVLPRHEGLPDRAAHATVRR